jgi:hypothetical protein
MYLNDHVTIELKPIITDSVRSVVRCGTLSMPGAQPCAIAVKRAYESVDLTAEETKMVSLKLLINYRRPH